MEFSEGPAVVFPQELKHYPNTVPYGYACNSCGASGCKLWRLLSPNFLYLACAECAASHQAITLADLDDKGFHARKSGDRTNQIGHFVPAVPVCAEDEGAYWDYSFIPEERYLWWEELPNKVYENWDEFFLELSEEDIRTG